MRSLHDETLRLLRENKGRWPFVAKATGVNYEWLRKLMDGRINDPGVKKMEALYFYLTGNHERNLFTDEHDQSRGKHAATGNRKNTSKNGSKTICSKTGDDVTRQASA